MRIIGNDPNKPRQTAATASGTLPNGKPVVVNADGTVSVVSQDTGTEAVGTAVEFEAGNTVFGGKSAAYDSANGKVIFTYRDASNSNYGTAVVGTVSGGAITFGTPVVFYSNVALDPSPCYDENSGKVVIAYSDNVSTPTTKVGTAIVGTVSGTTMTFGTPVAFETVRTDRPVPVYDSTNNKTVILYEQNQAYGRGVVGTVSGTSISFGSATAFTVGITAHISAAFSTSAGKILVAYCDGGDSYRGEARVGTVSGTSISFGNETIFETGNINRGNTGTVYDPVTDKFVISYSDNGDTDNAKAIVATVSGTSVTYGTSKTWSTGGTQYNTVVYHAAAQKVILFCEDENDSGKIKYSVGTISGTSLTTTTAADLTSAGATYIAPTYDSGNKIAVIGYRLDSDLKGYAQTLQIDYTANNLTAENYIGMSRGVVDAANQSQGSYTVFESASTSHVAAAYDSNNEKVVFAYADAGNSSYGTAVVGTISGNTISFGTPVIFESGNTRATSATFDSTNNKVVIVYRDNSNSDQGTAIVGEVSGNSISFGSAVIFNDNNTRNTMQVVFDSTNDKAVIAYSDANFRGKGIVGTISGTSISFGSAATFQAPSGGLGVDYVGACFDSTNGKVVVTYRDALNNTRATAAVGTVSGTSISFGSDVEVSTESGATYVVPVFDPVEGKVVVFFNVGTSGNRGRACVGTVSGTTITFGSENIYYDSGTQSANNKSAVYDTKAGKIVLGFQIGTVNYGALVAGKVSGNTITFDDVFTFSTDNMSQIALAYDSVNEKVAVGIRDTGNNNYGTGFVFTVGYENRPSVTDGGNALMDTQGGISENQISLTAGQSYYVQTDGTLSTTAGSPSVFAGTAVSSTKLIVKG